MRNGTRHEGGGCRSRTTRAQAEFASAWGVEDAMVTCSGREGGGWLMGWLKVASGAWPHGHMAIPRRMNREGANSDRRVAGASGI